MTDLRSTLPLWPALIAPLVRWIIYALIDPRYNTVRYIGKSSSGLTRPRDHERLAQKGRGAYNLRHCYNWIRQLQGLELRYEVVVLEEVEVADQLNARERWWIKFARAWGYDLTNLTDGGEGALGRVTTAATRAKQGAARRAAWADLEVRARQSAAWADSEMRARQSAATRAALADPAVKARQRVAARVAWADPRVKAKHCAVNARLDVKARISAALRVVNARPDVKVKRSAAARAASERAGRVKSATYRRLIIALPDATNVQVHAAVVAELGADRAGPLSYVGWYRRQLHRATRVALSANESILLVWGCAL